MHFLAASVRPLHCSSAACLMCTTTFCLPASPHLHSLAPTQVAPGVVHALPQGRRAQPAGRVCAQDHARLHHEPPGVGAGALAAGGWLAGLDSTPACQAAGPAMSSSVQQSDSCAIATSLDLRGPASCLPSCCAGRGAAGRGRGPAGQRRAAAGEANTLATAPQGVLLHHANLCPQRLAAAVCSQRTADAPRRPAPSPRQPRDRRTRWTACPTCAASSTQRPPSTWPAWRTRWWRRTRALAARRRGRCAPGRRGAGRAHTVRACPTAAGARRLRAAAGRAPFRPLTRAWVCEPVATAQHACVTSSHRTSAHLPPHLTPTPQDLKQLEMLEGQLTWLVHIIGAVVRGRMNTTGEGGAEGRAGRGRVELLLLCSLLPPAVQACTLACALLGRRTLLPSCPAVLHGALALDPNEPCITPYCACPLLLRRRCAGDDGRRPGGPRVWPAAACGRWVPHHAVRAVGHALVPCCACCVALVCCTARVCHRTPTKLRGGLATDTCGPLSPSHPCVPAARRYGEHSRQRLDLALLAFFQNFRKVYVGEQVSPGGAARCEPARLRGAAARACCSRSPPHQVLRSPGPRPQLHRLNKPSPSSCSPAGHAQQQRRISNLRLTGDPVSRCPPGSPPQVMHSSKVYLKLNERLGLSDHSMVLNIMLRCGAGPPCEQGLASGRSLAHTAADW